jgi:hypothetical protein
VITALAVSLFVVCLLSSAYFWLYRKPNRKSEERTQSQERFDKVELDTQGVGRKRSLKAELSAQTPRIAELVGTVEPSKLPASPVITKSRRSMMTFF